MLGDYMNYNARPEQATESESDSDKELVTGEDWGDIATLADFEGELEADEGYDPYNHPIDRRFLE